MKIGIYLRKLCVNKKYIQVEMIASSFLKEIKNLKKHSYQIASILPFDYRKADDEFKSNKWKI